jgi:hypothetical protein
MTNRATIKWMAVLLTLGGGTAVFAAAAGDLPYTPSEAGAAASPSSASLAKFKDAIRQKYDLKERAFAAHDAETILTRFYTADAISVGEGEGIFVGRDQLRPLYQDVVKENVVKIDSVYTFVSGNSGWDWADFHVTPSNKVNKPFTFAILFLWTQVHGQWMCKGDVFLNGSFRSGQLAKPPSG